MGSGQEVGGLKNTRVKRWSGFSLIELLIVVAIIAVVATIAIPSYTSYTQKSARADAMAALNDVRLQQSRYRLSNPRYAMALASISVDSTSPNGRYTVAITAANAASFSATATPSGSQVGDSCGTFAIGQNGPVTTGSYANDACWRR